MVRCLTSQEHAHPVPVRVVKLSEVTVPAKGETFYWSLLMTFREWTDTVLVWHDLLKWLPWNENLPNVQGAASFLCSFYAPY